MKNILEKIDNLIEITLKPGRVTGRHLDFKKKFTSSEIKLFKQWLDDKIDLYFDQKYSKLVDKLMDYYADEMPYGTAKGRTGDPDEWLLNKLEIELG